MCGQLLNLLDRQKILRISRDRGGERYVKHFDAWQHLVVMLYVVIKRFDSLREISDTMYQNTGGQMACRIQHVAFRKRAKGEDDIVHHARAITYVDVRKDKAKLVSLLTNDIEMEAEDIAAIYRKRWEIELLFKQFKQNFPLRYFYGERQRHQDTDLGDTHRQPAPAGHTEAHQKALELLRTCDDVQDHAQVLRQLLHFPRKPRKGPGRAAGKGGRIIP